MSLGETYGIDDVKKLYVRVGILLRGRKHFQDHNISLSGVARTQNTSPNPLLFIEVAVSRQERVMCMRDRVNDFCICFYEFDIRTPLMFVFYRLYLWNHL